MYACCGARVAAARAVRHEVRETQVDGLDVSVHLGQKRVQLHFIAVGAVLGHDPTAWKQHAGCGTRNVIAEVVT